MSSKPENASDWRLRWPRRGTAFVERQAKKLVARTGMTAKAAASR